MSFSLKIFKQMISNILMMLLVLKKLLQPPLFCCIMICTFAKVYLKTRLSIHCFRHRKNCTQRMPGDGKRKTRANESPKTTGPSE